ncbi:metallophosphoesterase [candidate division WOR-3 bacterium]|nr:metallophosphoesterase [candidate division WOR-3 bacterium]
MRFLHLSDSHLGESMPLYHTPPNNWRGEGFIKNYYRALKPALRGEVDFVLYAGDLFDKHHINMDIIGRAMVPLRKIASKKIPVFIVPGNHEREHIPGGLLLAGENIHIFSRPDTIEFVVRGERVIIVGFPYIRHESRTLFRKILKKTGWEHKKDSLNILLCHQTFEGAKVGTRNFTFRSGEHVVPLTEIPPGFDYIACGHIHKQQVIKTKGTIICYAGSTERVSFQEMNEGKGFYIVSVKNGILFPKFNKLPSAIMKILDLDTCGKSTGELNNFINKEIKLTEPNSILRFNLSGEIEQKNLKDIPLYLYKKKRNDVKIEFRKENLIILKDRKERIYIKEALKENEKPSIPQSIPIDNKKRRFLFTRKEICDAPISPGIYLLLNKDERVLYIGKANSLKNRLISHLRRKEKGNEGFYFWLKQVKKCDTVITGDEFSALFLEMSLIRSNLPPYNKQIKEFQNYVYLVVRNDIYFPTIRVVDEKKNDGNPYFGPFRKEYKIRENVKFIRELFGIRPCRRNLNDNLRLFSCPLEEMEKCDAPCTGGVNPSVYQNRIQQMIDFLYGNDNKYIKSLEKEKNNLMKIREFEKASELQRRIINLAIIFNSLRKIRKATEINGTLSIDFREEGKEIYPVYNGRVLWEKSGRKTGEKNDFPPQKWELDEMMLLLKAAESKESCFTFNKKSNNEKKD